MTATLRERLSATDLTTFRRELRTVILAPEHNVNLWTLTDESWSNHAATDFSRAAAWFLDQPRELTGLELSARPRPTLNRDLRMIVSNVQAQTFTRWATALGLASVVFGELIPDATLAVADALPVVFGEKTECGAPELRDRLIAVIPVLTGGAYARDLDGFLAEPPNRPKGGAGRALAAALLRLKRQGVIDFRRVSDAESLVIDDPTTRDPTHITWTR